MAPESQYLAPVARQVPAVVREINLAKSDALVRLVQTPVVRRTVLAGIAVGLGFQLGRFVRPGRMMAFARAARHVAKLADAPEVDAGQQRASIWVRESIIMVSAVARGIKGKE